MEASKNVQSPWNAQRISQQKFSENHAKYEQTDALGALYKMETNLIPQQTAIGLDTAWIFFISYGAEL
eukprot:2704036-Amphidinium_carterae.1